MRSHSKKIPTLRLSLSLALAAAACGNPDGIENDPIAGDPSFAAIPRPERASEVAAMQSALSQINASGAIKVGVGQDFYLAIHKRELDANQPSRFFLSAFVKQYYPNAVSGGASRAMGTKVVTFSLKNNKLYVLEVNDIKRSTRSFAPDAVIIDSFPVVEYAPFSRLPGASSYVLIDPGQSAARFSMVQGGAFGTAPFQTELSYLQNFRLLPDGVAYERIITGYSTEQLESGSDNDFRGAGTVGIAWRRYQESDKFQVVVPSDPPRKVKQDSTKMNDPLAPMKRESAWSTFFFLSGPRLRTADSTLAPRYDGDEAEFPKTDNPAVRYALENPQRKINWVISPLVPQKYQKAVKDGIEGWNEVFKAVLGRDVMSARYAAPGEIYDQDDKNFMLYDGDPTFGAAFANWRSNPLTGENLGSSVYINSGWFFGADDIEKNPYPNLRPRRPLDSDATKRPSLPAALSWDGVTQVPQCELTVKEAIEALEADPTVNNLSGPEQAQAFITHVVAHEVGHTLGLRHNFKGNLATSMMKPGGSSVMEYLTNQDSILRAKPGSYDLAALKLLYALPYDAMKGGYEKPTDPFCTDNGVTADPLCQTFDDTDAPFTKVYIPRYDTVVKDFLTGASNVLPNTTLNNVLMFLRAGASADQVTAWNKVLETIKIGVAPPMNAPMDYKARLNALTRRVFGRIFLDAAALRGNISGNVSVNATWLARYLPEVRGNLINSDNNRDYATRRMMVDLLKGFQNATALDTLRTARETLAGQIPGLMGDEKIQASELLARMDAAMNPYWAF